MVADEIAATPRDPIPIARGAGEARRRQVETSRNKLLLSAANAEDDSL